jgi:hypothetical protein
MMIGKPVPGTSPAIQQEQGLNRDVGVLYKKGKAQVAGQMSDYRR